MDHSLTNYIASRRGGLPAISQRLRIARIAIIALLVSSLAASAIFAACPNPSIGPDVIVGDITATQNFGAVDGIRAYSLGVTACNIGDQNANWQHNSNQHPVFAQNLYRLKSVDGSARFEQIGQSWLMHEFFALEGSICCPCSAIGTGFELGKGCSSPNTAGIGGAQANLGPRSPVNASTGVFPFPFSAPPAAPTIGRRLQVHETDVDPALNAGAMYFAEAQYVAQQEAAAGNGRNSASHRRVTVGASPFNLTLTGTIHREVAAIHAWKDSDAAVTETDIPVADDGLFILAAKATDLGGGMYRYEYALQNVTSHRSAQSFSVPVPNGATITNISFHDVDSHSGEPYSLADWSDSYSSNGLTWMTETFDANPNANALRWGTLYNFRFDINVPPNANGEVTIDLFRPGIPGSVTAVTVTPQFSCEGDIVPVPIGNGLVGTPDLLSVIIEWGACDSPCPAYCVGDIDHNCIVNTADLLKVINGWGPCTVGR